MKIDKTIPRKIKGMENHIIFAITACDDCRIIGGFCNHYAQKYHKKTILISLDIWQRLWWAGVKNEGNEVLDKFFDSDNNICWTLVELNRFKGIDWLVDLITHIEDSFIKNKEKMYLFEGYGVVFVKPINKDEEGYA